MKQVKSRMSEPDELGSPLERYMRAMFTHLFASMARNLGREDLSLRQLAALHLLDQQAQLRIGDLADQLALPLPGASRLVSDMVDRGLFERRELPTDRRAKDVKLTPAGHRLIETISRQRVAEGDVVLSQLDGEVAALFATFFEEMRKKGLRRPPGTNKSHSDRQR